MQVVLDISGKRHHYAGMPRKTNRGAIALKRAMRRHKPALSQGDVRREIGAPSGMVTRWLSGSRKPGREYAAKLAKSYGIKAESWDEAVLVDDDEPSAALTG